MEKLRSSQIGRLVAAMTAGELVWVLPVIVLSFVFMARTIIFIDGVPIYTLNDDTMISMRYAQHLAEGYGFAFNIGDPPVEGFTNLLWMLYMALLHAVFGSGTAPALALSITAIVQLVAIGFLAANVAVTVNGADVPGRRYLSFLCALQFGVLFWSLRGMETGLVVLLTLYGVRELFRFEITSSDASIWRMAFASALLLLTRPDTVLIVMLLTASCWLMAYDKRRWAPVLISVALPAVVQVEIVLFRLIVFGDVVPNTYYLKVVGVPAWDRIANGAEYLWRFSLSYLILVAVLLYIAFRGRKLELAPLATRFIVFTILLTVLLITYSVYVGGDFAETAGGLNRFILPCFPLIMISIWLGVARLERSGQWIHAAVFVLFCSLFAPDYWNWIRFNAPMSSSDNDRARIGLMLKRALASDLSFAGHAAGNTPYWSDRRFIDLLGKIDAHIARSPPSRAFAPGHNKWDYNYSVNVLKPDLIIDPFRGTDFFGDLSAVIRSSGDYRPIRAGLWIRNGSKGIDIHELQVFPPVASVALD